MNNEDTRLFKNNNYVFFALEAVINPKKHSSRFVSAMHRIPFDPLQLNTKAIMSLDDMIKDAVNFEDEVAWAHIANWRSSGLHELRGGDSLPQSKAPEAVDEDDEFELVSDRFLFGADKSLKALGLSVVLAARMIGHQELSSALLATDDTWRGWGTSARDDRSASL